MSVFRPSQGVLGERERRLGIDEGAGGGARGLLP